MKIFVHLLAFNSVEMIEGALKNFRDSVPVAPNGLEKTIFSCGYPIPNAQEHATAVARLAQEYGWDFRQIENRGVAGNWNQVCFEHFHIGPNDVVIGFDPDVRMVKKDGTPAIGWLQDMVAVLKTSRRTPYVCASRAFHDDEAAKLGRTEGEISGVRVGEFGRLIAWSMGGWRGDFLLEVGGFTQWAQVYGYIEHAMHAHMQKRGMNFVTLLDHYDDHQSAEESYSRWKSESAAKQTEKKFEDWLQK